FTSMPSADTTLYAMCSIQSYTFAFQTNGGTNLDNLTEEYGTSLTQPTAPIRALHSFVGWYRDSALTQAYSFSTMPAESLTLYAKWNENRIQGVHADDVSLSYDGQSHTLTVTGTQPGDTITYSLQETGPYTSVKPRFAVATSTPYVLWYQVTRDNYFPLIDSISLTIQGTQHQVTFETNGGSTIAPLENVYQGSVLSLPTPPTKANQVFVAWYRDEALTQGWNVERDVITSDITLFARYAATTHALGGIVSNQASAPIANATLRIYSGNALLASTMTNAQGEYSFDALPEGNYNVQIEIDNDRYQRFVQVPVGGNLAAHFSGLEQHFSLVLELDSSSPDIVIDGLEPLSSSTSSLITSQDQALVTSGGLDSFHHQYRRETCYRLTGYSRKYLGRIWENPWFST
ncbi:MAG: InlB B-repeat-containing protein, partial [Bacilli bacterium]